jgi:hypothetical protein
MRTRRVRNAIEGRRRANGRSRPARRFKVP